MVIPKGSGFVKKAGLITVAIILLATGAIFCYRMSGSREKGPMDLGKGTLVKEYFGWKKYYL